MYCMSALARNTIDVIHPIRLDDKCVLSWIKPVFCWVCGGFLDRLSTNFLYIDGLKAVFNIVPF